MLSTGLHFASESTGALLERDLVRLKHILRF